MVSIQKPVLVKSIFKNYSFMNTKKINKGLYAAKINDMVFAILKGSRGVWTVEFLNTSKNRIRTDLDDAFFMSKAAAIHQSVEYWKWLN